MDEISQAFGCIGLGNLLAKKKFSIWQETLLALHLTVVGFGTLRDDIDS
jgi:hypothetical protein